MSAAGDATSMQSAAISLASALLLTFPASPASLPLQRLPPRVGAQHGLDSALRALQSGFLQLRSPTSTEVATASKGSPACVITPAATAYSKLGRGTGLAIAWDTAEESLGDAEFRSPVRSDARTAPLVRSAAAPAWLAALPSAVPSTHWQRVWAVLAGGLLILATHCPLAKADEDAARKSQARAPWPVGVTGLTEKSAPRVVAAAQHGAAGSPERAPRRKSMSPAAFRTGGAATALSNPLLAATAAASISRPLDELRLPSFPTILAVIDVARATCLSCNQVPGESGDAGEPCVWQLHASSDALVYKNPAADGKEGFGAFALTFAAASVSEIQDWLNAFAVCRVFGRMCPQSIHWSTPTWCTEWLHAEGFVPQVSTAATAVSGPPPLQRGDSLEGQTPVPLDGLRVVGVPSNPLLTFWEELKKAPRGRCAGSESPDAGAGAALALLPAGATAYGSIPMPLRKYVAYPHWTTAPAGEPAAVGATGKVASKSPHRPAATPVAKTFTRSKRVEAGHTLSPHSPPTAAQESVASPGSIASPESPPGVPSMPSSPGVSKTLLGEGGFGCVFRATHTGTAPPAAYRPFLSAFQTLHARKWDVIKCGTPVAIKISQLPQRAALSKPGGGAPHPSTIRDALRRWKVAASEVLALERLAWYYLAMHAHVAGSLTTRVSGVFDTTGRRGAAGSNRILLKDVMANAAAMPAVDGDIFPVLPFLLDVSETLISPEHGKSLVAPVTAGLTSEVAIVMNLVDGHDLWKVASSLRSAAGQELPPDPTVAGTPAMCKAAVSEMHFPLCPYPLTFPAPESSSIALPDLVARLGSRAACQSEWTPALPEIVAKSVVHDVALALARLHALGIAHRDVKPENVQLVASLSPPRDGPAGEVHNVVLRAVLLDLGFAFVNVVEDLATSPAPLDAAMLRTLFGTRYAAAPEIWLAADAISEKRRVDAGVDTTLLDSSSAYGFGVDSWGLGVVMYVTLFGRLPFNDAGGVGELKANIVAGRWELSAQEAAQVSSEAVDLLNGLFRVLPEERLTPRQVLAHRWFR